MLKIGYGDVVPKNSDKKLYCVFAMLFSCAAFGYFLNTVNYQKILYLFLLKMSKMHVPSDSIDYSSKTSMQLMNRYMKAKKITF